MQDYILDLSPKNLYTVYLTARRKPFVPEDPELVMDRIAVGTERDAPVRSLLPDLYLLAALSPSYDEFALRFDRIRMRLGA